jgi:hypothetical protein
MERRSKRASFLTNGRIGWIHIMTHLTSDVDIGHGRKYRLDTVDRHITHWQASSTSTGEGGTSIDSQI